MEEKERRRSEFVYLSNKVFHSHETVVFSPESPPHFSVLGLTGIFTPKVYSSVVFAITRPGCTRPEPARQCFPVSSSCSSVAVIRPDGKFSWVGCPDVCCLNKLPGTGYPAQLGRASRRSRTRNEPHQPLLLFSNKKF